MAVVRQRYINVCTRPRCKKGSEQNRKAVGTEPAAMRPLIDIGVRGQKAAHLGIGHNPSWGLRFGERQGRLCKVARRAAPDIQHPRWLSGVVQARLFAFQDGADAVSTTAPFLAFDNSVVAGFVVGFVLGFIVVAARNFYF